MKVCHLTSVHARKDTRIFVKECSSLSRAGFDTYLIVADSLGNEESNGVNIVDVGLVKGGRLNRFVKTTKKVYQKAIDLDADLYHFHDPELMFYAYKLKRLGKKVIYDVHEDLPRQVMTKPYLDFFSKYVISFLIEKIEHYLASKFDAIVTVTNHISKRFFRYNDNTCILYNFPSLDEIDTVDWDEKKNEICYVGSISKVRGIIELVSALNSIEVKLNLGGKFNSTQLEVEVKKMPDWTKVNYLGFLSREDVVKVFNRSKIGIVTLHPTVNYIDALPVKMFEYMLAGIPVIVSDIPLWKELVEEEECGTVVDPFNISDISDVINQYLQNEFRAKKHGENGRQAIIQKYNWGIEEKKLVHLYHKMLEKKD